MRYLAAGTGGLTRPDVCLTSVGYSFIGAAEGGKRKAWPFSFFPFHNANLWRALPASKSCFSCMAAHCPGSGPKSLEGV